MSLIGYCIGAAQLTLISQPQTSGTYCAGPVTFTCVGTQIGVGLQWLVNNSIVATYNFRDTQTFPFPLTVDPSLDGVVAAVTSASAINLTDAREIDITSVLNASDVSVLNGASLQCEILQEQSNVLQIEVADTSKYTQSLL